MFDTLTIAMTDMECGKCGISFYVPTKWDQKRQETGASWYCPNGHCRVYRDPDAVRFKRERDCARRERDNEQRLREATERRNQRLLKEQKRVTRRVTNGVCPCCNRTFVNLQKHMKSKHPKEIT